jgi:urease accessory protein
MLQTVPPDLAEPSSRLQRAAGRARVVAACGEGKTRLRDLFQEGAAKIRLPRSAGTALEAVAINTSGGMTGGDRLAWDFTAEAGAALTVTTQASEKIYRAGSGEATVDVKLAVGPHARLCWLPQETILYDGSALSRTIEADIAGDAELFLVESVVFGRISMGETVTHCRFRDRWRIRVGGKLVHAEDFRIDGAANEILAHRATAGWGTAMATVVIVGRGSESRLRDAREFLRDNQAVGGAASHMSVGGTGKLLARMVAADGYALRKVLAPLVAALHGGQGLPKIWAT